MKNLNEIFKATDNLTFDNWTTDKDRTRGLIGGVPNKDLYIMPFLKSANYTIKNTVHTGTVLLAMYKDENGKYEVTTVPAGTFTRMGKDADNAKSTYDFIHKGVENFTCLDSELPKKFVGKCFKAATEKSNIIFPILLKGESAKWIDENGNPVPAKAVYCRSIVTNENGYNEAKAAFDIFCKENAITKDTAGYIDLDPKEKLTDEQKEAAKAAKAAAKEAKAANK